MSGRDNFGASVHLGPRKECLIRATLSESELDRYQWLKTIKDPKRLNALLPAWARVSIPARRVFTPGLPPKYPTWTYPQSPETINNSLRASMFKRFAAQCPAVPTTAEYVAAFNKAAGLKS
jgi:hypothetical protein